MTTDFFDKANIVNGREIAKQLNEETFQRLKRLSFVPTLCDIVVGDDAASLSYVKIKQRTAENYGFNFRAEFMPASSSTEEVVTKIQEVQTDPNLCGLIVQLPLPEGLNKVEILSAINPDVDVDVINPSSIEKFYKGEGKLIPPTAGAVMQILQRISKEEKVNLNEMQFVVAGQGELVGKPITYLLNQQNYKVKTISKDTQNAEEIMRSGDIVISGMGQPGIIGDDIVKDQVIMIDAGTSESEGSIKGDVDFDSVVTKAKLITPTPGGVGPVTVAKLLENVLIVGENK